MTKTKNQDSTVTVLNLATGEGLIYTNLEPIEALISAYLLATSPDNLLHTIARNKARKSILYGQVSAGLGNFAIKL